MPNHECISYIFLYLLCGLFFQREYSAEKIPVQKFHDHDEYSNWYSICISLTLCVTI
jgi:hypothetical protein